MRTTPLLLIALVGSVFALRSACADPIRHDFIAIDEGLSNLFRVDESDPSKDWLVHIGHPLPRDMQLEGGGKLLISDDQGYCEYDIATGRRLKDVSIYHDVSSARRLPNGHLLLFGVDFNRKKLNKGHAEVGDPTGRHVLMVEYDSDGREIRQCDYVGDYLRLARATSTGTYLFSVNTVFKEADTQGSYTGRRFHAEGFKHAWKALHLANGDTLCSAGFGAFMAEFDSSGALVRKFGGEGEVPPEVHPHFYALFQLLADGDVVVANWQGHGPGHGATGAQLIEFDPRGKIVWHWDNRQNLAFSSVQGVLVLDGLNPALLHDERNGLMEPLGSAAQ
jgi:hypothetical protein